MIPISASQAASMSRSSLTAEGKIRYGRATPRTWRCPRASACRDHPAHEAAIWPASGDQFLETAMGGEVALYEKVDLLVKTAAKTRTRGTKLGTERNSQPTFDISSARCGGNGRVGHTCIPVLLGVSVIRNT